MRIAFAACALLLMTAFAAPPAAAREKKATKKLRDINWGRRADVTMRLWTVHQHPYTRF